MKDAYPLSTPMDPNVTLSRSPASKLSAEDLDEVRRLPYRSLVGCLMYLAIGTRPDIAHAVQVLSQFLDCYTRIHWNAGLHVIRYLLGTRHLKLHLGGRQEAHLIGFTDASFASCPDTRRSNSAYCFSLGAGMVSWSARKQKTVALSTCDAEYIALAEGSREVVWLRNLLSGLDLAQIDPTPILCDNAAAIVLAGDPSFHSRAKHIDTKYHYIRECINTQQVSVTYVRSVDNVADILTKALGPKPFLYLRDMLGLR